MLELQIGGGMIWPPLKLLKSIQLLLLMALVRIFLTQAMSFQILISAPNLVIESGVHPSLHLNSRNQIVFARRNLKIQCPLLYEHLTWDYKNVNEQLINHTVKRFNWPRCFEGKNVHDQVYLCNPLVPGVH